MLAPVKMGGGMMSWCTECALLFLSLFFSFIYILFPFSRLLFKDLLSAVHSQNQMTSCLFLLWTAHNIVLYLFCFKLSLIKKFTYSSSAGKSARKITKILRSSGF